MRFNLGLDEIIEGMIGHDKTEYLRHKYDEVSVSRGDYPLFQYTTKTQEVPCTIEVGMKDVIIERVSTWEV